MVYKSRWTPEDKIRIVMESINTSASIAELCRKHGVVPNTFYQWKERFLEAGKLGLSGGLKNGGAASLELENENDRLKKLIGELTIANDSLKKAMEGGRRR
jgi:transposase